MIQCRGFEGNKFGIERGKLDDHRVLAQVQHRKHIQRVIIRPWKRPNGGVHEALGIVSLVPPSRSEGILFTHNKIVQRIEQGDVLIGTAHEVLHLGIVEFGGVKRADRCQAENGHHRDNLFFSSHNLGVSLHFSAGWRLASNSVRDNVRDMPTRSEGGSRRQG